jgi:hypothetical protein
MRFRRSRPTAEHPPMARPWQDRRPSAIRESHLLSRSRAVLNPFLFLYYLKMNSYYLFDYFPIILHLFREITIFIGDFS